MQDTPNPPKKRSRMQGDERRAFILAQAKKVFAQQGYSEASTSELARASGITEPMLYKHFGSKRNLFLTLLNTVGTEFMLRFREQVEQRASHDLLDSLSSLVLDYRKAVLADRDGIVAFFQGTGATYDAELNEMVLMHNQEIYALIYSLLKQAQAQELLSAQLDLNAAAWGYVSFLVMIQYRGKWRLFDQITEATLQEMNRLWFQGLLAE